jgi:peptidoglycan LD-endopeptidase LytH
VTEALSVSATRRARRDAARPRLTVGLAVLCVLAVLLPAGPAAAQSDERLRDDIRRLEQERGRFEEEAKQAEADLRVLASELADLRARREALHAELAAATARVDEVTAELARLGDDAEALEREVGALDREVAGIQAQLGGRIRAMYTGQTTGGFATLLSASSTSELYLRQHYLHALARHDRDHLDRAAAARRLLDERQAQLDAARREVARLADESAAAQEALTARFDEAADLEREVAERAAELDEVVAGLEGAAAARRREIAATEDTLDRRERERQIAAAQDAERRVAEARAAQRRAQEAASRANPPSPTPAPVAAAPSPQAPPPAPSPAVVAPAPASPVPASPVPASPAPPEPAPSPPAEDPPPPPASSGASACPQDNPRSFTDTWGAPRGGGRQHQGTDIFGARGGKVFAIADGVVEFTRAGGNAGLWLSLRGTDGHRYWYMHLQDFVAAPGQRVSAGELIAHNGDTGNARGTTPHIHFEYHPNGGSPVNPYPVLRQVCG